MKAKKITITIERRDLNVLQSALIGEKEIYANYLETAEADEFGREVLENFQSAARLIKIASEAEA